MPPLTNKNDALLKDDKGSIIMPDNYTKTIVRNGAGDISTISYTDDAGVERVQTWNYTAGLLTSVTGWEVQP